MIYKNILFSVLILMFVAVMGIFAFSVYNPIQSSNEISDGIIYYSNVCVYKNGELVGPCSHNLLYDSGKDAVKSVLGTSNNPGPWLNISLCNSTTGSAGCQAPVAGGGETYTQIGTCGLNAQNGAYASGPTGNWSVSKTFTSTCNDVTTNATRLMNSTGGLFAGNTFTATTLQNSDTITVNWSISVS